MRRLAIKYFVLLLLAMPGCMPADGHMTRASPQPLPAAKVSPDVPMDCADHAVVRSGHFWIENNTWGKGAIENWSQCVGIGDRGIGKVAARWTWNWPDQRENVKAYPEVVFGQKPGKETSTETLPRKVSDIRSATASLDYESYHTGAGNLAFDIWLVNTANPVEFSVPPITHEIMIWIDSYGGMKPSSHSYGKAAIDGIDYEIFVGEKVGKGWRYIAFQSASLQAGSVRLNLMPFFTYLKSNSLISGNEYVASIELGNEIIRGIGETRINSYSASVR